MKWSMVEMKLVESFIFSRIFSLKILALIIVKLINKAHLDIWNINMENIVEYVNNYFYIVCMNVRVFRINSTTLQNRFRFLFKLIAVVLFHQPFILIILLHNWFFITLDFFN